MTMIDYATGWFEIVQLPEGNKSSAQISQLFNNTWLCRYPRPKEVIFDNGSEFKMHFSSLLKDYGVKPVPTSVKNPQANAAVERVHQVIQNMLRTKDLLQHVYEHDDPFGTMLASVAWAVRASYHSTLQATPAQLVFNRDIVMSMAHAVNWKDITERKQAQIAKDSHRENSRRVPHDYVVNDQVYIIRDGIYNKLEGPHLGPFRVTQVYANGTVRIQRGHVNERINIRRLTPHFG